MHRLGDRVESVERKSSWEVLSLKVTSSSMYKDPYVNFWFMSIGYSDITLKVVFSKDIEVCPRLKKINKFPSPIAYLALIISF